MSVINHRERQEPRRLLHRFEAVAHVTTALAFSLTIVLVTTGWANELNTVADKLFWEVGWLETGVGAILVITAAFWYYDRHLDDYPRLMLAAGGFLACAGVLDLSVNLWILARGGLPVGIWWEAYVPAVAAVLITGTLAALRHHYTPMVMNATPARLWFAAGWPRQAVVVVLAIFVSVSVFASGVVMLPGVDSDHDGTASAAVEDMSYVQKYNTSAQGSDFNSVTFSDDGTEMYVVERGNDIIAQYSLSTAWDVSTASHTRSIDISSRDGNGRGLAFKPDGKKMYLTGGGNDRIYEYDLSTAWDISTASFTREHQFSGSTFTPMEVTFNDDGTRMVVNDDRDQDIREYTLSSAWNVSTSNHVNTFDPAEELDPRGTQFNGDGSKFFLVGLDNLTVYEYDVATNYDLSTASYSGNSQNVSSEDAAPTDLAVGDTGSKLYVMGNSDDAVFEYNSDISGFGPKISGQVLDEAGAPVVNATVYATGIDTADQPTIDGKNYEKHLENPLPSGWSQQVSDVEGFSTSPTYDTSEAHEQFQDTRVLMHTSENWQLDTVPYTAGMIETVPPHDVVPRAVTTPAEEQLFACWDFDQVMVGGLTGGAGGDGIDGSILGAETTPCRNITIQRIDPLDDPETSDTVEPEPLISSRSAANVGWSDDTGWAVKHHYGYRTDLDAGVYRVYPEGKESQAMYYAVAPNNDVSLLQASFENWLQTKQEAQSRWEEKLKEQYDAGNINIKNTTTDASGNYGLSMPDSVDRVDVAAVKGGPDAQGTADLTQGDVRGDVQSAVERNFESASAIEFQDADREQLQKTCAIMDSVADDVSVPYSGQANDIQPPDDNADIHGTRVIPKDLDERTRFCYAVNLAQQILEDGLGGLFPGMQDNLNDLSRAELEERYRTLMGYIEGTPVLKDALDARTDEDVDTILNEDPEDVSRDTLESRVQSGMEAIETGGGSSGGGGGGGVPGSGSDSPTVSPPDSSTGDETLNALWQVGNVDNWNDASLLVRLHYSNGTTALLNRSSPYVSVEESIVGSDTVRLDEYPLGDTDPATVRVELDVATPGGSTGDPDTPGSVVRNPTFDGEIPALRDMRVSTFAPGPSDNVSVSVTPRDESRFGSLEYANVSHTDCSYSVTPTDGELDIWTCSQGSHHVSVTFSNPGGVTFTETFSLDANPTAQSRPPTVRSKVGPVGRYAVTNGQLRGGDIQTRDGASVVEVIAIADPGNIPNSIVASTTNMDVAKDSDTVVRVVEGDAQQTVRKRVGVLLHRDAPAEGSLLYRNGDPVPSDGESPAAHLNASNGKLTMDSFTDETGEVTLRVNGDPSLIDRITHYVSLRVPVLSLSLGGDALLVVTPAVVLYRRRRKRPPNSGRGGQEAVA